MPALVINFSGGKDSTAMLAWLCEHYPDTPKYVVMADTGWEHEDAEDWARSIVERFGLELHVVRNERKDYLSMVRTRGKFPSATARQCTSDLKRDPIAKWIRNNVKEKVILNCMGIRREESPRRAKAPTVKRNKKLSVWKKVHRTVFDWNPILEWSEIEVYTYIASQGLDVHRVYRWLDRFSCRLCIFATRSNLKAIKEHDPYAFETIADLEDEIGFTMNPAGSIRELIKERTRMRTSSPPCAC